MEQYKDEILERAKNGETAEQIAQDLRDRGFEVSNKSINRWKLKWGMRVRRVSSTTGRKYPSRKPRQQKLPSAEDGSTLPDAGQGKLKRQELCKTEITARTLQGQSPDDIVEALKAQGIEFKKGASTVWRLQTLWGLIPYDIKRATGRLGRSTTEPRSADAATLRDRSEKTVSATQEAAESPAQDQGLVHYPSTCAHGPKPASHVQGDIDSRQNRVSDATMSQCSDLADSPLEPDQATESTVTAQASGQIAAEALSAELLADLAENTLTWANQLKDLCQARLNQRPAADSVDGVPPTDADIANAKKRVREAAAVMQNLAMDEFDMID